MISFKCDKCDYTVTFQRDFYKRTVDKFDYMTVSLNQEEMKQVSESFPVKPYIDNRTIVLCKSCGEKFRKRVDERDSKNKELDKEWLYSSE